MTRALVLLLPSLLAGCVTWTPTAPGEVSPRAVVLAVPVYEQQGRYDCGHATLSMVLAYYGHEPDTQRAEELRAKGNAERGVTGADLRTFLDAEGFDTLLFSGELSNDVAGVFYHLDRGRPLVVCISNDATDDTSRHFVLVVGYDPENELIFLQDPVRGGVRIANWQFDVFWQRCERFCLLAVPQMTDDSK